MTISTSEFVTTVLCTRRHCVEEINDWATAKFGQQGSSWDMVLIPWPRRYYRYCFTSKGQQLIFEIFWSSIVDNSIEATAGS